MKNLLCSLLLVSPTLSFGAPLEAAQGAASAILRREAPQGEVPPTGKLQFVSMPGQAQAQEAPDWKFMKGKDEASFRKEYANKVVLLDFWFIDCPYCLQATPRLLELHKKFGEKGLTIIGLNIDEGDDKARAQKYAKEKIGDKYQTLYGVAGVAETYGVGGFPTFVLIGPDGNIVTSGAGAGVITGQAFEQSVADALAKVKKDEKK